MAVPERVRVSDGERDDVVGLLKRHCADGRIELHELDERMGEALRARTRAELHAALRELPALPGDPRTGRVRQVARTVARRALLAHVKLYVITNLFLILIWAAAGRGSFWPIWPILGWGLALAIHASVTPRGVTSPARDPRRPSRPSRR